MNNMIMVIAIVFNGTTAESLAVITKSGHLLVGATCLFWLGLPL